MGKKPLGGRHAAFTKMALGPGPIASHQRKEHEELWAVISRGAKEVVVALVENRDRGRPVNGGFVSSSAPVGQNGGQENHGRNSQWRVQSYSRSIHRYPADQIGLDRNGELNPPMRLFAMYISVPKLRNVTGCSR